MSANFGQANPPWLLWGNTQKVNVPPNVGFQKNLNTLVRVSYSRPETWHLLLAARLISAVDGNPAADVSSAGAEFTIYTGLGRAMITFPVVTLGWNWGLDQSDGPSAPVQLPRWTNQLYNDTGQGDSQSLFYDPTTGDLIYRVETSVGTDKFVGQDITIVANTYFNTTVVGAGDAVLEVSAQVAPSVHVRPDWSRLDVSEAEQFTGGETGGR